MTKQMHIELVAVLISAPLFRHCRIFTSAGYIQDIAIRVGPNWKPSPPRLPNGQICRFNEISNGICYNAVGLTRNSLDIEYLRIIPPTDHAFAYAERT
jgi:hypothetical protein